jgi:Niemann-Pick C1 protein
VYSGENDTLTVGANYYMTYHTILRTSKDFYSSLIEARVIADSISETLSNITDSKVEVFPYSIFYVYYEQYLTMWRDVLVSLSISIGAIFVVTFILLGLDIHSSIVVLITIIMILVDLFGLMYLWDITLNAVSLVNLVMVLILTDLLLAKPSMLFHSLFDIGCRHFCRVLQSHRPCLCRVD